jgi:hypothetical protein
MSLTNYLEAKLLNSILRNTSYAAGTTIYLGLYTSAPGEDGSGIEVGGGSYVRQALASAFPAATADSVANSSNITFPTASAAWGTVSHLALLDGDNQKNFTNSNINTSTDAITITSHGFTTADAVSISRPNATGTFPTGITEGNAYYARAIDANTISLHPTAADATGNTNKIDITAAGSGTFYINKGNMLWSGALTSSKSIGNGDTFQIDSGNLTCALD